MSRSTSSNTQQARHAAAQEVLNRTFGHRQFRGRQAQIIDHVLDGQDALIIMPTGMGKSLCFQIPALVLAAEGRQQATDRPPLTLVLSPLIALMKDQVDGLVDRGIDATLINSSLDRDTRQRRYDGIAEGRFDLVYVAPERFRNEEFRAVVQQRTVVLLAVDEAHCISEWGHDFRPDYTRVGEIRQQLSNPLSPVTVALTATATPEVQRDIIRQLGLSDDRVRLYHDGIERPNLRLDVEEVWDDDDKLEWILSTRSEIAGSGIVYFNLIRSLESFAERLRQAGVTHSVYHGDLNRAERRRRQESFMEEPDQLVLATNAFGMGVDKDSIRFVLHADLPNSLESYYQEIGRAGRDGQPSRCLLLFDQRDLATQMEFLKWRNPDAAYYERVHHHLKHEHEQVNAFGMEWLRERLHARQKHDRRLETALTMMHRWGVIEGSWEPGSEICVVSDLPRELSDRDAIEAKLKGDQMKLLTMVRYAQHDGDRKAFLHDYFGVKTGDSSDD